MKRICLLILFLWGLFLGATAQTTFRPNAYLFDMNYLNPASGLEQHQRGASTLYLKNKFIDNSVWQKPFNLSADYRGRFSKFAGFYTAGYSYDGYSFFDRNTLSAGYTYEFNFRNYGQLNIGARAVLNFDKVNWDKTIMAGNPPVNSFFFNPDVDFGVQYNLKRFSIGVSTKNLFGNNTKVDGHVLLRNRREFYTDASYRFSLGQYINLTPYALLSWQPNFKVDLGARFTICQKALVGYHFRYSDLKHVLSAGVNIANRMKIGAAVDLPIVNKDYNLDIWFGYFFK